MHATCLQVLIEKWKHRCGIIDMGSALGSASTKANRFGRHYPRSSVGVFFPSFDYLRPVFTGDGDYVVAENIFIKVHNVQTRL